MGIDLGTSAAVHLNQEILGEGLDYDVQAANTPGMWGNDRVSADKGSWQQVHQQRCGKL